MLGCQNCNKMFYTGTLVKMNGSSQSVSHDVHLVEKNISIASIDNITMTNPHNFFILLSIICYSINGLTYQPH